MGASSGTFARGVLPAILHPIYRDAWQAPYAIGRARCVFLTASSAGAKYGRSLDAHALPCAAIEAVRRNRLFIWPQWVVNPLLALIAPSDCRMCGGPLRTSTSYPVCSECITGLRAKPLLAACPRCCEPVGAESARMAALSMTGLQACTACVADPPLYARATAFGSYHDLRPAIHLMKFEGVPSLAQPLGTLLAQAIEQQQFEAPAGMLLVPVPLYRRKRPFNQSVLLARSAIELLKRRGVMAGLELRTDLLHRVRSTESQFLLTAPQRRENVRGAFRASPAVCGCDVLLVDDVYTTGATVLECTRVLLRAGASSVRVATLARAGHEHAGAWLTRWSGPET